MSASWSLQDAKNRFSAVVTAAKREPQTVTKHGKAAVVVVDAAEVMVWLHNGGLTPAGTKVARYEAGGYAAAVFVQKGMGDRSGDSEVRWKYVALKADADLLSGSLDLRAVLVALREQGIIDGRDYIGGFELGAEVAGGAGSLRIDALDHDFSAYAITGGNDTLAGTDAADLIDGRGGADAISGLGGRDHLHGGRGPRSSLRRDGR